MRTLELRDTSIGAMALLKCKGGLNHGIWLRWQGGVDFRNDVRDLDLHLSVGSAQELHKLLTAFLKELADFREKEEVAKVKALEAELATVEKRHEEVLQDLDKLGWMRPQGPGEASP